MSSVKISVFSELARVLERDLPLLSDKPLRIQAVKDGKYVLAGENGIAPEKIVVKRVGKNLHVSLEGENPDTPRLIIEDFYEYDSQLIGMSPDSTYHQYVTSVSEGGHETAFLQDGVSLPLELDASNLFVFDPSALAGTGSQFPTAAIGLGALGLAGIGIAADSSGGSGSSRPATPNTPPPDKPGAVTISDESGSNNQPTISGTGTPGHIAVIRDKGVEIGSVVIGKDGTWSFTPNPPLDDGEHNLTVVIKDPSGNISDESDPVELIIDTLAPEVPTLTVHPDGGENLILSGTGEPGSTIIIRDNGNEIGSVVVDQNGNWSFTPNPALGDGEHSLTVEAVDKAGNNSGPSAPEVIIIDTTAPEAPTAAITDNGDGTLTITGSGEPGSTVNVTFPDGSTGSVVVDASGNYSIDSPAGVAQPNGEVTVNATDSDGNVSDDTVVAYEDTTAPDAPTAGITVNPDGSITVGGAAEPGSTVEVTFPDGSTGSVIVDESGQYELVSPPGQGSGNVEVGVVDVNGNPSDTTMVEYEDITAPLTPTIDSVFDDQGDKKVNLGKGDLTDDTMPTLAGWAEVAPAPFCF